MGSVATGYLTPPGSPAFELDAAMAFVCSQAVQYFRLQLTSVSILVVQRAWHHGYKPFRAMNTDTYMLTSPSGNILMTCDPETTHSILQDSSFGKPVKLMNLLNIFGPTITAADTPEARLYKKIAAPFFKENTMKNLWSHSIAGAEILMQVLRIDTEELRPVLARLTLYLLKVVCFEESHSCLDELQDRRQSSLSCHLSSSQAMAQLLEYFPTLHLTPPIILSMLVTSKPSRTLTQTRLFAFGLPQKGPSCVQ